MPTMIQRILAIVSLAAIVVLFFIMREQQFETRLLNASLKETARNADSLQTALYNASSEKGILKAENELKKLEIAKANDVLASVLSNMDEIARRESEAKSLMAENNPERRGRLISAKDYRKIDHEINSYLEAMYTTLNMSRQRVDELQGELEVALDDNGQLRQFVANLRRMVESQEQTITQLKKDKELLLNQLAQYEEENEALRKAWLVVGTRAQLKEKKIVRKPLLKALEIAPFDSTKFAETDTRIATIPLGDKPLKDISLLSDHRKYPEYFSLAKDGKSLLIKDVQQFWRVSKYLIVEVEY